LQSQPTLEGISFLNNGISEQAARAISELLASPTTLKKYHLDKNMTGDEGTVHIAAVLERATGIEDFKMAGSRFTSDGALMLAKALLHGSSLKKLNLTDNNVNEEGGEAFLEVFKKHTKLEYLNLEATALGEEVTGKVTQVVAESCPDLETLILSANDILREGVDSVAEGISKMRKLKVLKITDNELGDVGVAKICVALQTSAAKLEELDVSCNEISKSGAEAVSKLATTSLKSTIKKVNLDQNWIQEDAIESIHKIFSDAALDSVLQSLEDNDPDGEPEEDEADEVANLIAKLTV
jgi:Ran GTPase-activating protein 1